MAKVKVTVSFTLPAFTYTSGRRFVKDKEKLADVVSVLEQRSQGSGWDYQDFEFVSAEHVSDEGEDKPRYIVEPCGVQSIVRDNERAEIAYGPDKEYRCEAVRDTLQALEDGEA